MNAREPTQIVVAGLMPHAPVLIPAVANDREGEVAQSIRAMRLLSQRMLEHAPSRVVLISPHSPRRPGAFGIWETPSLAGSLVQFGCPGIEISLPNDRAMVEQIRAAAVKSHLNTWAIRSSTLDHGAMVPLYYLAEAGWTGPTTVLSLNYPGEGGIREWGACIDQAAGTVPGPVAVLASGDMSHRLKHGAPGGYSPVGRKFDDAFVALVEAGSYEALEAMNPELVEEAGEDVVDSTLVAASAVHFRNDDHQVLSYEGPFGVGYCVACLYESTAGEATI